jgi:COG4 transport protein
LYITAVPFNRSKLERLSLRKIFALFKWLTSLNKPNQTFIKVSRSSVNFTIFQESFEASSLTSLAPPQFTSLMLDDVFFIVKKCVRRAMSSQTIDGICAVANNACTILETDFCGLIQTQLRMGFPSGYLDLTMNVIQGPTL